MSLRTGRTSPCWSSAWPARCRWSPAFRLRVLRQPGRLLLTIVAAGAPFLVWDLYAVHAGHWRFDAAQTLPWRVAGLPLEEIAFFVVIPLATVLTYEAVRAVRAAGIEPAAVSAGRLMTYTAIAVVAVAGGRRGSTAGRRAPG